MAKAKKKPEPGVDVRASTSQVPLTSIVRISGTNPRQDPDVDVSDLVDSIRIVGLLQPIGVMQTDDGGGYEVVYGGRRWRALCALCTAGEISPDTPVDVVFVTSDNALNASQHENVRRKPLKHSEYLGYFRVATAKGLKIPQIAKGVGMTQAEVKRYLELSRLAPEVLARLDEQRIDMSAASVFTKLSQERQVEVLKQLDESYHDEDVALSSREVRGIITSHLLTPDSAMFDPAARPKLFSKDLFDDELLVVDNEGFMLEQQHAKQEFLAWLKKAAPAEIIEPGDGEEDAYYPVAVEEVLPDDKAAELADQVDQLRHDVELMDSDYEFRSTDQAKRIDILKTIVTRSIPVVEAIVDRTPAFQAALRHVVVTHRGGMFTILPYCLPADMLNAAVAGDPQEQVMPQADVGVALRDAQDATEADDTTVHAPRREAVRKLFMAAELEALVSELDNYNLYRWFCSMVLTGAWQLGTGGLTLDEMHPRTRITIEAAFKGIGVELEPDRATIPISSIRYNLRQGDSNRDVLQRIDEAPDDAIADLFFAIIALCSPTVGMRGGHDASSNAVVEFFANKMRDQIGAIAKPQAGLLSMLSKAELAELLEKHEAGPRDGKKKELVDAAARTLSDNNGWINDAWVWRR